MAKRFSWAVVRIYAAFGTAVVAFIFTVLVLPLVLGFGLVLAFRLLVRLTARLLGWL